MLSFLKRSRIKAVMQDEVTECGLACISMVASSYGSEVSLRSLRNKYPVKLDSGLSLFDLLQIGEDMGLAGRALQFDAHELEALKLPAILHWGSNHYVVLSKVNAGSVEVYDPALGRRTLSLAQALSNITGYAVELGPGPRFQRQKAETPIRLRDFFGALGGLKSSVFHIMVLGVMMQITMLLAPIYVQLSVDEAIRKTDIDILYLLTIMFGMVFFFEVIFYKLLENIRSYVRNNLSQSAVTGVSSHLSRLSMDYYLHRTTGDVLSRVNGTADVARFVVDGFLSAVLATITCVLSICLMFYYNWLMALISLLGLMLFALARVFMQPKLREAVGQAVARKADSDGIMIENIRSAQTIKLMSSESVRGNLFANAFTQYLESIREKEFVEATFNSIGKAIINAEQLVILCYGGYLIMKGDSTIGLLYAFIQYKNLFADQFVKVVDTTLHRKVLQVQIDRAGDILDTDLEDPNAAKKQRLDNIKGRIEARNLSYAPRGLDRDLLKNVSLTIEAGEKIGIIGRTGAGKTSLLRLMAALYPSRQGQLYVDNVDMVLLNVREYRKNVAAVMQDDDLFRGPISANICGFDASPNRARMIEAAKLACLHDDIEKFDDGYGTMISDSQRFLSAGQVQRLLLARAFYREPSILLLDEFTSNLDTDTARMIWQNILKMPATVIIITHENTMLDSLTRIYRVTDGVVSIADDIVKRGQ